MSSSVPQSTKQWTVTKPGSFDDLEFSEKPIPTLGDNDCLVKRE